MYISVTRRNSIEHRTSKGVCVLPWPNVFTKYGFVRDWEYLSFFPPPPLACPANSRFLGNHIIFDKNNLLYGLPSTSTRVMIVLVCNCVAITITSVKLVFNQILGRPYRPCSTRIFPTFCSWLICTFCLYIVPPLYDFIINCSRR